MLELGLLQHWMDIHTAKSNLRLKKCMETVKQIEPEKQANIKPLTLSSLSGAFILLLVGYVTATLAICFELLIPTLWLVCKQASAYKIYTKLKQIVKLNNKPQEKVKQRLIIVKKKLQRKSHKFKADPKKVEVNNTQVNFDKTEVIPNSSEVKDRFIPKPEITIKVNRPKPKVNYDLIEVITVSSEEDKETIIKIGENRGISFLVFGLY